jgi:hypothetical protein
MWRIMNANPQLQRRALSALLLGCVLLIGSTPGFSRGRRSETIEASAMGTGTQLGAVISITLDIYDFSTPDDKQVLLQAFAKSQNQGLVNALSRMKAVGHVSITGTLGYDCSYIAMTPTPTGRVIRFVTNRQIKFGEAYFDTQSMSYNLTGGEIQLNDQDKSKSTGVVYPAAQIALDSQGNLQIQLRENAWKLLDVIDWPGTLGIN